MENLILYLVVFKEKIMFKSHYIKSSHRAVWKYKIDTHGAPVLEPGYSATVLVASVY
jgi:hypothetical protein